jgi:putative DNA primase/helicase
MPPLGRDTERRHYLAAAIERECRAVASAQEGTRNNILNTAAFNLGQLVGSGALSRGEVERALLDASMSAGLDHAEAAATIQSGLTAGEKKPRAVPERAPDAACPATGASRAAAVPVPVLQETQYSLAERVAALHANDLRYDHRIGRWLFWTGQTWQPGNPTGEVTRLIVAIVRDAYSELGGMEDDAAKRRFKFLRKLENAAEMAAVARLLQTVKPVADAGEAWDSKPNLLGVENGVVDLSTGRLRDGHPDDRITLSLDVEYAADAAAPRWERFISEVFPDLALAAFIKRAIGYSLTGHTREQCFFLCHGKGSNGKSVLLAILSYLLGPLYAVVPFSTFLIRQHGADATNDLAGLVARRVVSASETSESSHLNEARLKSMTGGDIITARFLFREFFSFYPMFKIWIAVNHRPRVADDSLGFWRRVRLIPFERAFTGAAADADLLVKLRLELPGILAWAVRGAVEWYAAGLQAPPCVLASTAEYRKAEDPLDAFLEAACDVGPEHQAGGRELHLAYTQWADDLKLHGRDRMTATRLGRLLSERFRGTKTCTVKVYHGLRVRSWREPGDEADG